MADQRGDALVSTPRRRRDESTARWEALTARYLPVVSPSTGWRYSRVHHDGDVAQGWKLHVSATLLDAVEVFERCAPVLAATGVVFKSVKSLGILSQLNSGIPFGFSQIGKFMTVYPRTVQEALSLAARLDEATTGLAGPRVPFDRPYRAGGLVHYRYGAFSSAQMRLDDGRSVGAIHDPSGVLVPDLREPGRAVPEWAQDPFPSRAAPVIVGTPLQTRFLCYDALMQRGKGGVYKAVDISRTPAVQCVVKEGRRIGETAWDGTDGYELARREENALRVLHGTDVLVPEVIDSFDVDASRYLAMEYVDGTSLHMFASDPERKLPVSVALAYAHAAATVMSALHRNGWAWRDCKPANLVLTRGGVLRPVDFEGATPLAVPETRPWGSPGYVPPEAGDYRDTPPASNIGEDLYALGATIHQLCTSWLMHRDEAAALNGTRKITDRPPLGVLRKGVPEHVRRLCGALLSADPARRPSAAEAVRDLAPYRMDPLPVLAEPGNDSRTVRRVRDKLWADAERMVFDRQPAA